MRRYGKHTDEDDIRVRPSRRGTRPRTHTRPKHEDASGGRVLTVDRGRLTCLVEGRTVTAMKARELGRKGVVVGDRVALVGDLSGAKDTLARVVRVEERTSVLRRTADDNEPYERVIVANADQLAIVTALADPEPRPRLVDRCLVAAYDAGLDPLLVLTKSDLAPAGPLLDTYAPLGLRYAVTSRQQLERGGPPAELLELLRGRTTVCVGHSGVGKTTLVNALVPERQRATGDVNAITGRGRHTTTAALALPLADGGSDGDSDDGWVIDTPGVRSFGLNHVQLSRVIHAFPDLEAGAAECPRACSHNEPGCALDRWVAEGHADPARLASLRRLLATRERREGD
ncbi:ribosome small subunit-dependent GTPase A [Streptomyces boncukensis]|uniref:Small ribosomal subunit biogenesis GTPase RsgA n=1 Tax=Streptomyces boncukensis TaxID=2711219 RepID=A0A6G4WQK3_9ACTN|nr:ribosome small subunit-dependent GTPase A [Streptomyces boncukensis]NGO67378.1 ribosome small subunit-dependent GTPase A [Streptomyces boncukensis]